MSFLGGGGGSAPQSKSHDHGSGDGKCCQGKEPESKDHPIFNAVKSGMLVPVQTVHEEVSDIFNMRDDKGHTPAHWACLGGHSTVLRYMIESKANVNEPSDNDLGARPIHWACVNGHIAIVDILLQSGVSYDVADNKGCTPLIVAAQYGHTMMAGYLMGKGARLQICDKDGDNALHWAAFKGHSELMRLLIYSGFNPRQQDVYGQTPLHLACISGNLTAVQELCEQDGVEIDIADKNGKTPISLATGRKHDGVVDYLKRQIKQKKSLLPKIDLLTIAFGPPGNSKGAILFFMMNVLCWGYPMYVLKCLPYTWNELQILHIFFFIFNVLMWFCLFHASTTDPGYLPRNIPEYDMAIKQVAHFDEWKQGENPLSRLCHTCRTVKPLRSKHCRICNRCVIMFDHHCPYIYNCVGYKNRVSFIGYVINVTICGTMSIFFSWYYVQYYEQWNALYMFFFALMLLFESVGLWVGSFTLYNAAQNITTNERLRYHRYKHMQDKDGNLFIPFDQGLLPNLLDYFHIKPLPSESTDNYFQITSL
ncbi:probable protein S-acyltransferase 23 isoform X1 [Pecten maximus]|uniref:probable protein S-acyltransferase 23 isoform X1 n=1 Tax=Pecten maximus TaxID=6579 RepID=UPI001458C03C|nr:probable protein S-acyltransferase 23 isoform X1 [Pecten maximus]